MRISLDLWVPVLVVEHPVWFGWRRDPSDRRCWTWSKRQSSNSSSTLFSSSSFSSSLGANFMHGRPAFQLLFSLSHFPLNFLQPSSPLQKNPSWLKAWIFLLFFKPSKRVYAERDREKIVAAALSKLKKSWEITRRAIKGSLFQRLGC